MATRVARGNRSCACFHALSTCRADRLASAGPILLRVAHRGAPIVLSHDRSRSIRTRSSVRCISSFMGDFARCSPCFSYPVEHATSVGTAAGNAKPARCWYGSRCGWRVRRGIDLTIDVQVSGLQRPCPPTATSCPRWPRCGMRSNRSAAHCDRECAPSGRGSESGRPVHRRFQRVSRRSAARDGACRGDSRASGVSRHFALTAFHRRSSDRAPALRLNGGHRLRLVQPGITAPPAHKLAPHRSSRSSTRPWRGLAADR